ncbi:DUF2631 domain-containing protein [Dactylosporangium aurantiacum]|uniref:DUF2631 domain-containing protein n=1 Tax=Dactylosporangium aurantiacum TaxID=35754 RepID=A0A9Q9MEF1_9ACTN|nr:DUF2631 domain-containing protein [Dactylosporangium aurantiacum]MDG6104475.1 DUF2631 domain-containing protein [Dactylosporangium aurantiacum]UWZ56093.1 DUF2631 domain-containing protein [Dactylosporangium aurantiacum]
MAEHEPVTSPDQLKPGHPRAARIGAAVTALLILSMIVGNHQGRVEDIWLIASAGVLVLVLVADWVLRRNGLR